MTTLELTCEAFDEKYKPLYNHFETYWDDDAVWDNMSHEEQQKHMADRGDTQIFNTSGEHKEFVDNQPVPRVWSVIEGDKGWYISRGYRVVNLMGYIVAQVDWKEGDPEEYVYSLDSDFEEEEL